eukprot:CAMPEP_0185802302 /NCGR_PEP_ID=MMETSP1322-20130828/1927_1 /TAXON_ID=265543 /ORGANISM="Minutocellus polymorphus, Strain RCC2270" /LENGTH=211 /DNA_ID=CAMNT_0028498057 /DNA_START=324 /DNA_END=959 /DNA_ORIENTATION=+
MTHEAQMGSDSASLSSLYGLSAASPALSLTGVARSAILTGLAGSPAPPPPGAASLIADASISSLAFFFFLSLAIGLVNLIFLPLAAAVSVMAALLLLAAAVQVLLASSFLTNLVSRRSFSAQLGWAADIWAATVLTADAMGAEVTDRRGCAEAASSDVLVSEIARDTAPWISAGVGLWDRGADPLAVVIALLSGWERWMGRTNAVRLAFGV